MVRNFSTGGGHGPGDTIVEGDGKIVTQKWQGHPPVDLTVMGKPHAPLREVVEPRYRGTAEFATRVRLPGMLYAKYLRSPYPRSSIRRLDTSAAEKMPGVHHILTYRNAPKSNPLPTDLAMQGDIVAIVAADTEDQAEDAIEAIVVDYLDLPSVTTLANAEADNAPDITRLPAGTGTTAMSRRVSPNPTSCGSSHITSAVAASFRCSPTVASPNGTATSSHSGGTDRTSIHPVNISRPGSASTRTTSVSSINGMAAHSAAWAYDIRRSGA
jgi:hypothetical protein